jgi:hypothetical protein
MIMRIKAHLRKKRWILSCGVIAVSAIATVIALLSMNGPINNGPFSKKQIARGQIMALNAVISAHYRVIDAHSFPSLNNKDITETLEAANNTKDVPFPKSLYEKNGKGEMVDPWGRPIVFVREGDRVVAKPPGTPPESK